MVCGVVERFVMVVRCESGVERERGCVVVVRNNYAWVEGVGERVRN